MKKKFIKKKFGGEVFIKEHSQHSDLLYNYIYDVKGEEVIKLENKTNIRR